LAHEVAGLPTELDPESEEAKRFDLLLLNLQLALLRHEPAFERLRKQVMEIAGLLEEKAAIPTVKAQMSLIQDIQTDEWWEDVTLPMLEGVRRRLRDLVQLIEKQKRKIVYTDFEDETAEGIEIPLPGFAAEGSFEKFLAKARSYLRAHQDHIAIHKLRMNRPLTATDLEELERMLAESGIGNEDMLARAKKENQGLGPFVRSLVGLDREAAKLALGEFLDGQAWSSRQIDFLNLIVNHLTENGMMDAGLLYESPFTDVTPSGPEGLFNSLQVDKLLAVLDKVKASTRAA
jgi:type I restriction enzyme R subunit